jgi:hypothetical protein
MMMVYNIQYYWVSRFCPSGFLKIREHDVSETESVSVLSWGKDVSRVGLDESRILEIGTAGIGNKINYPFSMPNPSDQPT